MCEWFIASYNISSKLQPYSHKWGCWTLKTLNSFRRQNTFTTGLWCRPINRLQLFKVNDSSRSDSRRRQQALCHSNRSWMECRRLFTTLWLIWFSRLCHHIAVKELPSITPANIIRALESDFKDVEEETVRVSQDDVLFLERLKSGTNKNIYGHYQMPLPFKARPKLPKQQLMSEIFKR